MSQILHLINFCCYSCFIGTERQSNMLHSQACAEQPSATFSRVRFVLSAALNYLAQRRIVQPG